MNVYYMVMMCLLEILFLVFLYAHIVRYFLYMLTLKACSFFVTLSLKKTIREREGATRPEKIQIDKHITKHRLIRHYTQ